MNKDLLELWGKAFSEMAQMAGRPHNFFHLFQNGFARTEPKPDPLHEQFVRLCQKAFGKEGIETFNGVLKEFYENVGVVPRTQYNELREKYEALKRKVKELEETLRALKDKVGGKPGLPGDLADQWEKTMKQYAEINREFFKEFSKFFTSG
jgi:predicted ArsR family transcriptional regulator